MTLTIDEDVLRAARVRAVSSGTRISEVIEAAVRKHLGLDLLGKLRPQASLGEDEAAALAVEAQHRTRAQRR